MTPTAFPTFTPTMKKMPSGTLGYVHAQDRLWQMELLRRAGAGRLSEIFGELTLETDKFFLSLGIDDHNEKALANLDRNQPLLVYYLPMPIWMVSTNSLRRGLPP